MKRAPLPALAALLLVLAGCPGRLGLASKADERVYPEQAAAQSLPEDAFRVVEFGPTGVVPWENVEGGVWVLFSDPVVPLARLGEPIRETAALRIEPAVAGVYRWYGSRLLSFEPEEALQPATEYTVSLDPAQRSLEGKTLAGMNAFRFRTPPLRMVALDPEGKDVPPEACRQLAITFSYPVDLALIRRSLRVEADGRARSFTAAYAEGRADDDLLAHRVVVLKMKRELPWDRDVVVRLLQGARPGRQNYGTLEDRSLGFHTLKPFELTGSEVQDRLTGVTAELTFNHPLKEGTLLPHLVVDLEGWQPEGNVDVEGGTAWLHNLPAPFESSFTLRLRAGLEDLYGQQLAADRTLQLEVGPAGSYVRFHAEGDRFLESGFPPLAIPPKVVVEFQNATSGAWAAGRLENPFDEPPDAPFTPYDLQQIPRNTRIFRAVDFTPFLNEEGKGSAFARWKFTAPVPWEEAPQPFATELRLQVTDLGLTSHIAWNRILLRVARLSTGEPVAGAEVVLRRSAVPSSELRAPSSAQELRRGTSGADGLAAFDLQPGELAGFFGADRESLELEVRSGKDRLVFRPARAPSWTWNFSEPFQAEQPRPVTYITQDRGIYRPGETVSFFGVDRDLERGAFRLRQGGWRVSLQQGWSGETTLARQSGTLSPSGRFWGELSIPETAEPDDYLLFYEREDGSHSQRLPVRVAFFRRVNFAVQVDLPKERRLMGGRLEARFGADYLAGGRVSRGSWSWWWSRTPVDFAPPDPAGLYAGFRFGRQGGGEDYEGGYAQELSSAEGPLGGDGTVAAAQGLADGQPGRVYRYQLNATIEDVDRQAVSSHAGVQVFTSELLIGARLSRGPGDGEPLYFVGQKEPFTVTACLVRPDGTPFRPEAGAAAPAVAAGAAAGRLEGRLLREEWKMVRERSVGGRLDTRWAREELEEGRFTLEPGAEAGGRVLAAKELRTGQVGYYIVELRGRDGAGREALTRVGLYSTGSGSVLWQRGDENRIELVADRPSYAPGDRARLLIKSPLEKGLYLLTVEREGLLEERTVRLEGNTGTVEVEVKDGHVPVVYVTLSAWTGRTAAPPDSPDLPDLGKPRGCFGTVDLQVRPDPRRITLAIESARPVYRPGSEAEVTVKATHGGQPLEGAEIALVAADRGVLDLIDYHIGDPLEFFYSRWNFPQMVSHADSRALLLDPVAWKVRDMPGGDKEGEAEEAGIPVRRDFRATAVFQPTLVTGPDGTARLRFRLPDSLTTFRVTAVGTKADPEGRDLFGRAESEIRVQNPLNVRAALPRRLRVGDEVRAGVVLTNLDSEPRDVSIRMASGLLEMKEAERRVTVPAGGTVEVAFRFSAPRAGTADVRFAVESDGPQVAGSRAAVLRERLEATLPVDEARLWETATLIGQTETSVQEGFVIPPGFLGAPGNVGTAPGEGLRLSLDSTIASSLTEAIRFLDLYPYDCLEQRTSKLFAYVLYDWLLEDRGRIGRELARLPAYQTAEGGFAFWSDPAWRAPDYYVSLRTAHLLRLAESRGYLLPAGLDRKALRRYLLEAYGRQNPYLKSYALFVLAFDGADVRLQARDLLRSALPAEASGTGGPVGGTAAGGSAGEGRLGALEQGLLGLACHLLGLPREAKQVLASVRNTYRVGTRSVTLTGPIFSGSYYGGEVQAKAVLLMLYQALEPGSQTALALADDLLAASRKGYWGDTSDTGWVLQAFAGWLNAGERDADFRARVQLGASVLASPSFRGLSRSPYAALIEPPQLLEIARREGGQAGSEKGWLPLFIGKEGRGRLYYSAALRAALPAAGAEPRDEGIGLFVEVLGAQGRPVPAGEALKLGQVYRLRAVLSSTRDRDFLALRLPLPSGAEAVDGSLQTSEPPRPAAPESAAGGNPAGVMRVYDDEVRFVFDTFRRGRREVSFLFRTTTPGEFPTPPAQAELMYEEEVFGRTAGRTWQIAP